MGCQQVLTHHYPSLDPQQKSCHHDMGPIQYGNFIKLKSDGVRLEFQSKRFGFFSLLPRLQKNAGFPSLLLWTPEVIFYEDSRPKDKTGNAFCLYPLLQKMFALHDVLRTHTQVTDYLNRLPVSAALTSDTSAK